MASVTRNSLTVGGAVVPALVIKLTRGRPVNLGTIAVAGDVVAFDVPEPVDTYRGYLIIQVGPGNVVIGVGTFALEVSIDDGASWAVVPVAAGPGAGSITLSLVGQPGADPAALFMAQYSVGGMGSGARFRFGFVASPTSGSAPVWAMVG
jgi:hypothetical protein